MFLCDLMGINKLFDNMNRVEITNVTYNLHANYLSIEYFDVQYSNSKSLKICYIIFQQLE